MSDKKSKADDRVRLFNMLLMDMWRSGRKTHDAVVDGYEKRIARLQQIIYALLAIIITTFTGSFGLLIFQNIR